MSRTRLTFLGAAGALPGPGEDTVSWVVNGDLLFDCGWCAALRMQELGLDPTAIETVFLTHCHQDHYLGLPSIQLFRSFALRGQDVPPLRIVGPADDLPLVVELARSFLQADRFPKRWPAVECHPLWPGETYESGKYRIETTPSLHGVTGFSGRLTDLETGAVVAFSSDTAPNPALVELARGADLLIHEASLAPDTVEGELKDHSRATDAAAIAKAAGVRALRLVHLLGDHHEASLRAAREIFPATELARAGERLELPQLT